jgi:GNAT superfamily N-acetyltransferase
MVSKKSGETQSTPPQPVTVVPATPEYWTEIQDLFARVACWCQYWRVPASAYGRSSAVELRAGRLAAREAALRAQLEGPVPPGMLALLAGQAVGWCGFGPRPGLQRLVRSRSIPAVDDLAVWSIVCFLVRVGYRRRGVARALLQGTIETARAQGAPGLEAYPVDPGGRRIDGTFAYVGTIGMFQRAGFRRVLVTEARSAGLPRWLVRLAFTP